ncbi:MAG: lysophospholipid acyltransferase family protein [Tannerella sp.]|jgi:KDO2-lipid IV(A) lauroyltransferase|nr:lysophospholipid acyltransferase family protein [Tannerella sp.]
MAKKNSFFQSFGYAIIWAYVKVHAMLPMAVLYLFADFLYFFVYKIARYRLKIVRQNLRLSFPEMTDKQLSKLEKRFYHHFSDYIVETIKLAHISQEELNRRAVLHNPEIINPLVAQGHTCFILLMGHYGNWEWFTGSTVWFDSVKIYQIYRPLTSKIFDRLFIYLRTRFQGIGIKKQDTVRDIIKLKQSKERSLVIFIADQSPGKANLLYWTNFLNRESSVLTGPERIATKLDIPVIFVDVKKIKRGYYTVDFELITDSPRREPEFWITEQYARLMERSILRDPAYWLWTHKRWKHQRG